MEIEEDKLMFRTLTLNGTNSRVLKYQGAFLKWKNIFWVLQTSVIKTVFCTLFINGMPDIGGELSNLKL